MQNTKTVYIIEDNPDISELMTLVVEKEGYSVEAFSVIQKAEVGLEKGTPNLIIMDLTICGEDGSAFTKKLKQKKSTSKIPIILVSAKNSLADIAKESGADAYLAKPFNIKDLTALIKKLV